MSIRQIAGLAAVVLAFLVSPAYSKKSHYWGADYFPNLPVVTQDGEKLMFYDDVIKDKIVVINFIYTTCPDICPLTTARMAQLQERLGDRVGKDIFFYSISVDPKTDTPEVLKTYAQAFNAGPGWQFLTGDPEQLRAVRHSLGDRRRALNEHTQEVRLGNGTTGEWQRAALLGDIESLLLTIKAMDPKWRAEERVIPHNAMADTGIIIKDEPGQALFRRLCVACHTVGVGDRIGPDLSGVLERRTPQWIKSYIMNPVQMRAAKDPIALELRQRYPHVKMPSLGIKRTDADELVEYLKTEETRLAELNKLGEGHDHSSHQHPAASHANHGDHGSGRHEDGHEHHDHKH